jgi:hypothetical protein
MARRRDNIGRVRWKLWELLRDAGFSIPGPECLWMQEGFYRSNYHDLARWGADWTGLSMDKSATVLHSLFSWDTMTDCVRLGIEVSKDKTPHCWEIHRKEEPHEKAPA